METWETPKRGKTFDSEKHFYPVVVFQINTCEQQGFMTYSCAGGNFSTLVSWTFSPDNLLLWGRAMLCTVR